MTMMEEIMENLGVELNEVFCIRVHGSKLNGFRFIEKGPKDIVFEDIQNRGHDYFYDLLNGAVTVIKNPWRPKDEQIFYYVLPNGMVTYYYDQTHSVGINLIMIGNCYRSKYEAEQHIDYWKRVYKDMPEFKEDKR